jgi:hypothetical protein
MAATAITPTALTLNAFSAFPTFAAVDSSGKAALIPFPNKDDGKILLMFLNSDSTTAYDVTVKKGNGLQAASADLTLADVTAGAYVSIVVETGKYAQVSGTDKGYIKVVGENAAVKVAAIYLP